MGRSSRWDTGLHPSTTQLHARAASLQTAVGRGGEQRGRGAGPSGSWQMEALQRPWPQHMLPWASWLIELSSLSLAPPPAPEGPALKHHGKGRTRGLHVYGFPLFPRSLSWFLGSLSRCPPCFHPRYQQGLTHSQNSRMESILGGRRHSPSFQGGNGNLERACGLSGVAQQVGPEPRWLAASAPQPRPPLASESRQKLHKIRTKGSFLGKEVTEGKKA